MNSAAQTAYDRMGTAITSPDETKAYALLRLVETLTDPLDILYTPVTGTWETQLDSLTCPKELLPWLAQLAGTTIPSNLAEKEIRQYLQSPATWIYGTVGIIENTLKTYLRGTKYCQVFERTDSYGEPNPWHILIHIFQKEKPANLKPLEEHLRTVIDAEIQFTIAIREGKTFAQLAAQQQTFQQLATQTYTSIFTSPPLSIRS